MIHQHFPSNITLCSLPSRNSTVQKALESQSKNSNKERHNLSRRKHFLILQHIKKSYILQSSKTIAKNNWLFLIDVRHITLFSPFYNHLHHTIIYPILEIKTKTHTHTHTHKEQSYWYSIGVLLSDASSFCMPPFWAYRRTQTLTHIKGQSPNGRTIAKQALQDII